MLLDLLLQINVPAKTAVEISREVIEKSTLDTPMETIRSIILDSLRERDEKAADRLETRFDQVRYVLTRKDDPRADLRGEIYDAEEADRMLEADEITAAELYFMEGREGRSWQRKTHHRDSTSTAMTSEDRYDD
jgi:hypothetical protein